MTENERECLINKMADNLPMFRVRLNLSQEGFSNIIGISRYTLLAIEKKQRKMSLQSMTRVCLRDFKISLPK